MIPRGHKHHLYPTQAHDLPDGSRQIHSVCHDRVVEAEGGLVKVAGCGLEEQRRFDANGVPIRIRYRYGGLWFAPLDLLRVGQLPIEECPACHGEVTLTRCQCNGLGVVEVGAGRIVQPALVTH